MNSRRSPARDGVGLLRAAAGESADARLLDRFLADRDDDAFAALVARHGPMLLGVCRRAAGHEQDAEDAFQATFLVLARRAADVRPADRVGCWLYGVAYRTARKARACAGRRRDRERPLAGVAEPPAAPPADGDLAEALDAELSRLPDHYRVPLVLCDLEGRPRRDVARELGIPEGTLSSRLTTARQRLAERLARRGVSTPAVGAALAAGAVAVPSRLATAATRLVTAAPPAPVAALADAAGRAAPRGWRAAAGLAAAVAAGGWLATARLPEPPPVPARAGVPHPVPPAAGLPAHLERVGWALTRVATGGRAVDLSDRAGGGDTIVVLGAPPGLVVSGLTLRNLAVEPGAAVVVDGRPATPADLRPGMWVRVRLAPGRLAVTAFEARSARPPVPPPTTRCVVAAADPTRGVVDVEIATGVRVGGLVVTPHTPVEVFAFGGEPFVVSTAAGGVPDLRAGATVDLDLDLGDVRVVVRRARTTR